jgi:uracil-DNA glycosylase family 4
MSFIYEDIRCSECQLWSTSVSSAYRRSGVYGKGSGTNGLLIIGEALSAVDVEYATPFVGRAGSILTDALREVHIDEKKCYITNVIRCKLPNSRAPTLEESRFCQKTHSEKDQPFLDFQPKLIVLLGLSALRTVTGMTKITERRGIFYPINWKGKEIQCIITYHPNAVLRQPKLYAIFKEDLMKASGFLDETVYDKLPNITREYINSEERFYFWISYLLQHPEVEITIDVETTGLILFKDTIISIAFVFKYGDKLQGIAFLTTPKEEWWHLNLKDPFAVHLLIKLFLNRETVFHNGDFDTKMFWSHGIYVNNTYDTLDAHHLVDENLPHGLKFLVTQYLPSGGGYQHTITDVIGDKGAYFEAPAQILLDYNLNDTYYTYLLKQIFTRYLHTEETFDVYTNHAMPLRRTLTRMSYRGILVDKERVLALSDKYRKQIVESEAKFFQACGQEFNYGSPQQLANVLYNKLRLPILLRTPKNLPSTGKDVLTLLKGKHGCIEHLLHLKHLKKMITTYLDGDDGSGKIKSTGILQYLDDNNRIHTSFLTFGTPSGRLSARSPSLLNIPRDPDIRMNFMAPPGWKLLDFDFKQAEYVALAYFSQDPGLLDAIKEDVHEQVVRRLMGFEGEITKDIKTQAKIVNYRKIFGGGPTDEKMAEWYRKWDRAYPLAITWMKAMQHMWKEQGFITGVYGRKRRFPPAFDQKTESYYNRLAINFPCQNSIADTCNRSLYLLDQALERIYGWSLSTQYKVPGIVLAVHDNIITEVPDEHIEDVYTLKHEIMTLPMPEFNASLRVDCHIVQRWGEDSLRSHESIEEDIHDETLEDLDTNFQQHSKMKK